MSLKAHIKEKFKGLPVITGDFSKEFYDAIPVKSPSLVENATAHDSKHGIKKNFTGELGIINFSFTNLAPRDAWGAGIVVPRDRKGNVWMAGVHIDLGQNYSVFQSYSQTNRDGMDVSDGDGLYAEDLTVVFCQDAAVDTKALKVQINRMLSTGNEHRKLRFWRPGPHVVTNSILQNNIGSILWCKTQNTKVYFWNCLFNGQETLSADKVEKTDDGGWPQIIYLDSKAEAMAMMDNGFGDIGNTRAGEGTAPGPDPDPDPPTDPTDPPTDPTDPPTDPTDPPDVPTDPPPTGDPTLEARVTKIEQYLKPFVP